MSRVFRAILDGMDNVVTVINLATWVFAAVGFAVAAIFIVNAGYLFISSQGDPQRVAQARHALIGVVIGLVVIGGAFLIPGTISRFVIEPAGGVRVETRAATDCDDILRTQLVFQRNAGEPAEMQYLVHQVQGQHEGCSEDTWNPVVYDSAGIPKGCRDYEPGSSPAVYVSPPEVGGAPVPDGLQVGGSMKNISYRDSENNIIVYFSHPARTGTGAKGLPSDGASCWLYVAAFRSWASGYLERTAIGSNPYIP